MPRQTGTRQTQLWVSVAFSSNWSFYKNVLQSRNCLSKLSLSPLVRVLDLSKATEAKDDSTTTKVSGYMAQTITTQARGSGRCLGNNQ